MHAWINTCMVSICSLSTHAVCMHDACMNKCMHGIHVFMSTHVVCPPSHYSIYTRSTRSLKSLFKSTTPLTSSARSKSACASAASKIIPASWCIKTKIHNDSISLKRTSNFSHIRTQNMKMQANVTCNPLQKVLNDTWRPFPKIRWSSGTLSETFQLIRAYKMVAHFMHSRVSEWMCLCTWVLHTRAPRRLRSVI